MDCLVLEGDSQPSVHLVHQMLGVRGGHVEIFGGLGLEELWKWVVLHFCPVRWSQLSSGQVIWAFRCQQQMLPLNPSALWGIIGYCTHPMQIITWVIEDFSSVSLYSGSDHREESAFNPTSRQWRRQQLRFCLCSIPWTLLCCRLEMLRLGRSFQWMLFVPVPFIRAAERAGVGQAGCWRNPLSVQGAQSASWRLCWSLSKSICLQLG